MTISTQGAKSPLYNGNGVTTAFSTTFPFQNNSDLGVYTVVVSTGVQTKLVLNTNYTVSGAGNPSGGTVTITVAPVTGVSVRIIREAPYTQTTDYVEGTSFPAETHESALDKATMLIQQVKEAADRSLQFAVTSTNYPMTFPNGGTANAGKVLQWNSPNGTALINTATTDLDISLTGGTAITVSGHYTIDLDINKQASLGTVDMLNDYLLIRDATDGVTKKIRAADVLDVNLLSGQGITISSNVVNQDYMKQAITTVDRAADYVLFYDSSAGGYRRALAGSFGMTSISQDTTPTLGGDLDFNGFSGVSTGNNIRLKALTTGNINLEPGTSGVVSITPASGSPTLNVGTTTGNTLTLTTKGTNSYYIGEGSGGTASGTTLEVGLGRNTLASSSGTFNLAIGGSTFQNMTTGTLNAGLGAGTGNQITSGGRNALVGAQSGYYITTGTNNTGVGTDTFLTISGSGANMATGTYNTAIGYAAGVATTSASYTLSLGHGAIADGATGTTNATNGGGFSLGSTLSRIGFRGDNTPFPTSGAAAGYLRVKINGTYYKIQIMAD